MNPINHQDDRAEAERNYRVLSLFSGCGGLDLGIEGGFSYLKRFYHRNPFKIVWANDISESATATQALNFEDLEIVTGDIACVLADGANLPAADLVIGGFPCQDFSLAGKRRGVDSARGRLFMDMSTVLRLVRPQAFLAENVKGILSWNDGMAIRWIINEFTEAGYRVDYRLFKMANYGVPQTRERVIIIGVRQDLGLPIYWPLPTHVARSHGGLPTWRTIYDAIDDIKEDRIQRELPNFHYSLAKLKPGAQGNSVTNARLPGPTISAEHHGNIDFHYELPRRLSVREAARIQTFPDSFEFLWSMTDAYRQIGNAVPPVFAWHLAQSLQKMLSCGRKR